MEHLDIKIGKYTLVSKVGDGGMAEVFKARVIGPGHFEKTVALKKILPNLASNEKFRRSFIDEARICGQLHHHNIVEVYNFHDDGKDLYLAMEFIDGLNLEDVLDYHREIEQSMTTDVVMSIMVQVLEGLEYAHTARSMENQPLNVIHRDLKPSNILIDNEGVVKIVDFGVARAANRRYETQEMTAKGTASYMAPEQLLGDKPVTQASDIFSVGAMFYEMLTLERLFDGDHVFAILKQVATMEINDHLDKTLHSADRRFLPILRKALARELSDRYKSAAEMLRDVLGLHIVGHSPRRLADHLREIRNTAESLEDAATRLVTNTDYDDDDDLEDQVTRMAGSEPAPASPPAAKAEPIPDATTRATVPLSGGTNGRIIQAAAAGGSGAAAGASGAGVAGGTAQGGATSGPASGTSGAAQGNRKDALNGHSRNPDTRGGENRPAQAAEGGASSRPASSPAIQVTAPTVANVPAPAAGNEPTVQAATLRAPAGGGVSSGLPSILPHESGAQASPHGGEVPVGSSGLTTPSRVFQMRPPEPPTSMAFSILIGAGVGGLILLLLIYFSS